MNVSEITLQDYFPASAFIKNDVKVVEQKAESHNDGVLKRTYAQGLGKE